jgi:hypothetical protein
VAQIVLAQNKVQKYDKYKVVAEQNDKIMSRAMIPHQYGLFEPHFELCKIILDTPFKLIFGLTVLEEDSNFRVCLQDALFFGVILNLK